MQIPLLAIACCNTACSAGVWSPTVLSAARGQLAQICLSSSLKILEAISLSLFYLSNTALHELYNWFSPMTLW